MLSGSSGVFITPVFPRAYPTNIQCRWTITAPSGHRIELKFLAFDLGSSPQNGDCSKDDFVEVRDSDNKNDPSYGPLCGNAKPSPVLSVGPKMVVTFKSDEKKVFEGFFAKYDAIPEGNADDISTGNGGQQDSLKITSAMHTCVAYYTT